MLAGYDIVVNAAYDHTVLPAIQAAIHNRAQYCDANTRFVEQALQLTSEAEAAGTTAILANGIGPGTSNTMGVHVARQLDAVEQLQRGLGPLVNFGSGRELTPRQWFEQPRQSLAALPEFKGFIGWMLKRLQANGAQAVRDYRESRWVETNPIRSGVDVPRLQGGSFRSHPFVSTKDDWGALPADLSPVPAADMWFSALPPQLDAVLLEQALRVVEEGIDPDASLNAFYDTAEKCPQQWLTVSDDYMPVPVMWVRAVGRKGGRVARCACWFTAPMWEAGGYLITSMALVAAAFKVLRGEIQKRGVMTAETAFEPRPFFDEMAALLPDQLPDGKLIDESFEWLE